MQRSGPLIYYLWRVYASCISRNPFKALSIHVNHNECIFEDIFFSCVLLPNSVVCTRRFVQGAAQSLPRVVCPYALSANLFQRLRTKNLVNIRLLKGNLI